MKTMPVLSFIFLTLISSVTIAAESALCMEGICIGDDAEALDVEWKKVNVDYKAKRAINTQLASMSVEELYYDYNEILITSPAVKKKLAPKVIQLQKFDAEVLDELSRVRAICTDLSLTGQVESNSRTKLFITFRAIADSGGRGKLRVVQIDKEFNIFPPHLRPADKEKYVAMLSVLKKDYPELVLVRDIDARADSNEVAFASALLGYRFFSDVNNPLIFRIRDQADIDSIEFDENRSPLCPAPE